MRCVYLAASVIYLAAPLRADYTVTQLLAANPYHAPSGDYGRAFDAAVSAWQVSVDPAGNLYILEYSNSVSSTLPPLAVRRITPDGNIQPVTGMGVSTLIPGQRIPALLAGFPAGLTTSAITVDRSGNLFAAGGTSLNRVGTDGLEEIYA